MRLFLLLALVSIPPFARGEGPLRAEVLEEGPPAALSGAIRSELEGRAYRVFDGRGKPFLDIWLRKAIPASERPSTPSGRVQFPVINDGTLLGAVRYNSEGQDFRDQTIAAGVYTLRFGIQPANGAHARQSPFRDFALLLPTTEDRQTADLPRKPLEEKSAEAAGSTHPAVLTLLAAKGPGLRIVEDEAKRTRGVVVPLSLAVKGDRKPSAIDLQIVVSGTVPTH
jgi:hypothetical protein